jgi:hypothetical protein
MKYLISTEIEQAVDLESTDFSLTNQGKVNTLNILKMYSQCHKRICIIRNLPSKVITMSGLFDGLNISKHTNSSEPVDEEKIKELIETNLSINSTYRINDSLLDNEQYYVSYVICNMVENAIEFLTEKDIYGNLIRHVFDVRFSDTNIKCSERIYELKDRLRREKDIEPKTYYKYLRYTIYRIDEYLFSEKNTYLHFLNGYIFDKCKE